ncbi:MAG: DUF4129 domain-containing protein [Acidimicrobiales bacterium]
MPADPPGSPAARRRRPRPTRTTAPAALLGFLVLVVVVAMPVPGWSSGGATADAAVRSASSTLSTGTAVSTGTAAIARAADELPVPTQDPSTSNQKADQILGRDEFQRAQPGFFQRAQQWLGERLAGLISGLFTGGVGSAVAWVILASALALIAVVAVRVGRTVQPDPTRSGPSMQVEVRRSPIEWRREAERFEARGEWKAALRCRYRALVADLVARKVVRDLAGHTTGEYRADVTAALPDAAAEFAGATELFERAWYGDRPTGADENARFRELAERVVDRAEPHARSTKAAS